MWEKKLKNKVREYLKGYTACHDCYHLQRVENYALEIAEKIDCDKDILKASALLHDIGYRYHEKDMDKHNLYGMEIARQWLKEVDFPKEKIPEVVEAIRLHDNLHWDVNGEKTNHIETMIIQDADRIEALGAIGISRLTYFYGEQGWHIYNSAKIKKTKKVWLDHSLLDQINREALKKWANLNFDYSKKISKKRNEFLKRFYQELKMELSLHHKIQKEIK